MTLLALRRYAIRNRTRIRFAFSPAGECVVTERGLLQIPALKSVPDYSVEDPLDTVEQFSLEPVRENDPGRPRQVSRLEMESLLGDSASPDREKQE